MRVQPYLSAASKVAPSADLVPRNAAGISLSRWKSRRRHSAMSVFCTLKVLVSCMNRPVRTRFIEVSSPHSGLPGESPAVAARVGAGAEHAARQIAADDLDAARPLEVAD